MADIPIMEKEIRLDRRLPHPTAIAQRVRLIARATLAYGYLGIVLSFVIVIVMANSVVSRGIAVAMLSSV